jgi:hypothetical protein
MVLLTKHIDENVTTRCTCRPVKSRTVQFLYQTHHKPKDTFKAEKAANETEFEAELLEAELLVVALFWKSHYRQLYLHGPPPASHLFIGEAQQGPTPSLFCPHPWLCGRAIVPLSTLENKHWHLKYLSNL